MKSYVTIEEEEKHILPFCCCTYSCKVNFLLKPIFPASLRAFLMAGWHRSLLMIGTFTFLRVFLKSPPFLPDPQPDAQQLGPVPF